MPETCHITLEASSRYPYNIGLVIFFYLWHNLSKSLQFCSGAATSFYKKGILKNEFSEKEFFIKKGILNQNLAQTSDDSVQPCSQLKIWNRFNPHKISNFTTLSFPFISYYSIPFILIDSPRKIWVENVYNLGITRGNIYTNICCKLDVIDLYILSGPNQNIFPQTFYTIASFFFFPSSKEIGCQWVLFLNSYETTNPNELEFWDMIPLWVQMVIG